MVKDRQEQSCIEFIILEWQSFTVIDDRFNFPDHRIVTDVHRSGVNTFTSENEGNPAWAASEVEYLIVSAYVVPDP